MNCTPEKCPHAALMELARSLCLGCDHTEPAGHGGKVSFEAMGEYLAERTRLKFGKGATQGPLTLSLDLHDEDALRMLLATLAALNRSDAVIVWHLLNGRTPKQIAKIEGVTRQAIHVRIKGFVRRHPDLAVLYESMMRSSRDELAPARRDGQGQDRNGGSIRRADRVGVGTPGGGAHRPMPKARSAPRKCSDVSKKLSSRGGYGKMSAKFTDEQLAGLLDGIASGMPMGALAGIAGVSSPTLTNRLHNAEFLRRLVGVFDRYDAATVAMLERLEHWWNYPGEREVAYRLRQRVAKALRDRFHDQDDAEQRAAKRKGVLRRGGVAWRWNPVDKRWEYGSCNWWRGSISGE